MERAKILCIEDETLLLADLREELMDAGYDVLGAIDGLEALDILQTEKPDLILCDMMMPVMDGPTTLKHVRERMPQLSHVPFVFLTAKATREDLIAGRRLGVDDYLTKPVDFDLLLATVETRLREVRRIENSTRGKLKKVYDAFKSAYARRGPVRISIVTGNAKAIEPITSALKELGCVVTIISEEQLAKKSFCIDQDDIVFLVYSKVVHYYLRYVTEQKGNRRAGKIILLTPTQLSNDDKSTFLEAGIDSYIEYPYRPVEIFKLIMSKLQANGQAA